MKNISILNTFKFGFKTTFNNRKFFLKLSLHSLKAFTLYIMLGIALLLPLSILLAISAAILNLFNIIAVDEYHLIEQFSKYWTEIMIPFSIALVISGWIGVGLNFIDNNELSISPLFIDGKKAMRLFVCSIILILITLAAIMIAIILIFLLTKLITHSKAFSLATAKVFGFFILIFGFFYLLYKIYITNLLIIDKNYNVSQSLKEAFSKKVKFKELLYLYIIIIGYTVIAIIPLNIISRLFNPENLFIKMPLILLFAILIIPLWLSIAYLWRSSEN